MLLTTRHACFAVLCSLLLTAGCGGNGGSSSSMPPPRAPEYSQTDLVAGAGASPKGGDLITVNYTGWLYDPTKPDNKGKQFDTSIARDREPFTFTLRAGQVIPGWDMGFEGMKLGGKRRLIIPPHLGYGADGTPDGSIPPNSTLVFEMQLLDIKPK
jgi:FKBP-type peptidyl-prolyl cis-trans isomerase FkpA